jgi:hypothetical protein
MSTTIARVSSSDAGKLGLVLSGGGARTLPGGVYERLLRDRRFAEAPMLSGTSAGALNAAMIAADLTPTEMMDFGMTRHDLPVIASAPLQRVRHPGADRLARDAAALAFPATSRASGAVPVTAAGARVPPRSPSTTCSRAASTWCPMSSPACAEPFLAETSRSATLDRRSGSARASAAPARRQRGRSAHRRRRPRDRPGARGTRLRIRRGARDHRRDARGESASRSSST